MIIQAYFVKSVGCPVIQMQTVDTTDPKTAGAIFKQTSHVIVFDRRRIIRTVFINCEFHAVVFI